MTLKKWRTKTGGTRKNDDNYEPAQAERSRPRNGEREFETPAERPVARKKGTRRSRIMKKKEGALDARTRYVADGGIIKSRCGRYKTKRATKI